MRRRNPFFESSYDGVTYRQTHRLDPRLFILGIVLTVLSVPLILWTWPALTTFGVTAIGVALVSAGFVKRHHFSVSPEGYFISWSVGPAHWSTKAAPDEVTPMLSSGRAPYTVLLRCGWQTLDPLIEVACKREGEAWLAFLLEVSSGVPSAIPQVSNSHIWSAPAGGR
jgi:energy-coupling factor transporter transmembrane protein EcfT